MSDKKYNYLDIVMALFLTALIVSNVASSAKIITWGITLLGLPMSFDGGTLLFPISYIFGDILTEVYGYHSTKRIIWIGFLCTALAGLTFWVVSRLPGDPEWGKFVSDQIYQGSHEGDFDPLATGHAAYDAILGGMSSGAIIMASLIAYLAGEFSNSYVLARMKILTKGRHLWMRTIGSTLIGQAFDTCIFTVVATFAGVFPISTLMSLIIANFIFKVSIEALFTPATYRIINFLKRVENEDFYDFETNFNPFSVSK